MEVSAANHERSPNPAERKGRLLQTLVRPGRHDVTDGSGGKNINAKPASESQDPTTPWQRHASGCHEAGHDGTEERHGFTTTIRKATKREPTESTKALTPCAADASGHSPELNKVKATPEGQNALSGALPKATPLSSTKQRNPPGCKQRDPSARTARRRRSAAAHPIVATLGPFCRHLHDSRAGLNLSGWHS